jgi:hypothetical protein
MPLRALARSQDPMRETVSQFQRMLGRMKDFSKPRVVAGKEFGTIKHVDLEHRGIPFHHRTALNEEEGTLPWGSSSDQVHLLLALRLFRGQIGQLIEGA